jgi:hypothetical protein
MPASAQAATSAHRRCKASAFIVTTIAALSLSAAIAVVPAAAQTTGTSPAGDTPSVGIGPTDTKQDDPNSGQWFVFKVDPGGTAHTEARIGNPANVPQTVKLYLADLVFGKDGTPTIPDRKPSDVGSWGRFDQEEVTIQPQKFVRLSFRFTVPDNADPGDHVGAVVAESAPEGGAIKIIKRVATRMYVTVPGDATKSLKITNVTKKLNSFWFPSALEVTTLVTNTGRVRLNAIVGVNGHKAEGTDVLLARSVEKYTTKVKVPWYGGPVTAHVKVDSEAGTKTVAVSLFVIPWGVLAMIPLFVLAGFVLRMLARARVGRVRRLHADLRRLEGMVTQRQTGEGTAMAALAVQQETLPASAPPDSVEESGSQDQIRSLREAFKRAQRTGSQEGLENVSLSLHAAGVDARDDLRVALERAEGARRDEIEAALAFYAPPAPEPEVRVEPAHEEREPQPDPFRSAFLEHMKDAFDDEGVSHHN